MTPENNEKLYEDLFIQLILSLSAAGMQQMGKIANPFTGQVEFNLEQASGTIDLLAMLKAKSKGNLSRSEESLLDTNLTTLRMTYVVEVRRQEEAAALQANKEKEKPAETAKAEAIKEEEKAEAEEVIKEEIEDKVEEEEKVQEEEKIKEDKKKASKKKPSSKKSTTEKKD